MRVITSLSLASGNNRLFFPHAHSFHGIAPSLPQGEEVSPWCPARCVTYVSARSSQTQSLSELIQVVNSFRLPRRAHCAKRSRYVRCRRVPQLTPPSSPLGVNRGNFFFTGVAAKRFGCFCSRSVLVLKVLM